MTAFRPGQSPPPVSTAIRMEPRAVSRGPRQRQEAFPGLARGSGPWLGQPGDGQPRSVRRPGPPPRAAPWRARPRPRAAGGRSCIHTGASRARFTIPAVSWTTTSAPSAMAARRTERPGRSRLETAAVARSSVADRHREQRMEHPQPEQHVRAPRPRPAGSPSASERAGNSVSPSAAMAPLTPSTTRPSSAAGTSTPTAALLPEADSAHALRPTRRSAPPPRAGRRCSPGAVPSPPPGPASRRSR